MTSGWRRRNFQRVHRQPRGIWGGVSDSTIPWSRVQAKKDLACVFIAKMWHEVINHQELSLRELFFLKITRAVLISRFWTVVGLGEPENRISHLSNLFASRCLMWTSCRSKWRCHYFGWRCLGPPCWMVDAWLLLFPVGPCLKKNPSDFFCWNLPNLRWNGFLWPPVGLRVYARNKVGVVAGCFLSDQCMFRMFGGW